MPDQFYDDEDPFAFYETSAVNDREISTGQKIIIELSLSMGIGNTGPGSVIVVVQNQSTVTRFQRSTPPTTSLIHMLRSQL